MPWEECSVMDERLQFVGRRLAGGPMAQLCREFGISRNTGYKIFERYRECGAPEHAEFHRHFFGTRVRFNGDYDGIVCQPPILRNRYLRQAQP